jgi:hypothetical protein
LSEAGRRNARCTASEKCRKFTGDIFPLAKISGQAEHWIRRPNHGPTSHIEGGGIWDKTSEVPEVHGA